MSVHPCVPHLLSAKYVNMNKFLLVRYSYGFFLSFAKFLRHDKQIIVVFSSAEDDDFPIRSHVKSQPCSSRNGFAKPEVAFDSDRDEQESRYIFTYITFITQQSEVFISYNDYIQFLLQSVVHDSFDRFVFNIAFGGEYLFFD